MGWGWGRDGDRVRERERRIGDWDTWDERPYI